MRSVRAILKVAFKMHFLYKKHNSHSLINKTHAKQGLFMWGRLSKLVMVFKLSCTTRSKSYIV